MKDKTKSKMTFKKAVFRYWQLYILLIPGLLYFIIFKYLPMYGVVIAFKDYYPWVGFFESEWVGFEHFQFFFNTRFEIILRNTLRISALTLGIGFTSPIILALLLNEVRVNKFKRIVQTISYLPYFLSWVIAYGIIYNLFNTTTGLLNHFMNQYGMQSPAILAEAKYFLPLVVSSNLWKMVGFGTIIYLAALTGVDTQLYEAAMLDGANRWKQLLHVTLPSIASTIAVLFLLSLGGLLYNDFQQLIIFLGDNRLLWEVGDVFETHVFRVGLLNQNYSYGAAVGLLQSGVGLFLVVFANKGARKFGYRGIF